MRYDIIAHSLGGAVAALWAAAEQDEAVLAAVHSVVALDSPVRGQVDPENVLNILTAELTQLGGSAGNDLADYYVIQAMSRAVEKIDFITLSNTADGIVPESVATFPGSCPDFLDGCVAELPSAGPDPLGHLQMLRDPWTMARIDALLDANTELWLARNVTDLPYPDLPNPADAAPETSGPNAPFVVDPSILPKSTLSMSDPEIAESAAEIGKAEDFLPCRTSARLSTGRETNISIFKHFASDALLVIDTGYIVFEEIASRSNPDHQYMTSSFLEAANIALHWLQERGIDTSRIYVSWYHRGWGQDAAEKALGIRPRESLAPFDGPDVQFPLRSKAIVVGSIPDPGGPSGDHVGRDL